MTPKKARMTQKKAKINRQEGFTLVTQSLLIPPLILPDPPGEIFIDLTMEINCQICL